MKELFWIYNMVMFNKYFTYVDVLSRLFHKVGVSLNLFPFSCFFSFLGLKESWRDQGLYSNEVKVPILCYVCRDIYMRFLEPCIKQRINKIPCESIL